jgi:phosphatidylglycerophosphatase A
MDHHSRLIAHLMPTLVGDMSVPQLEKYFDRRRFQTGVCKEITLLKLRIDADHEMKSVPTTLINDNKLALEASLTAEKAAEQSVALECFDFPLVENSLIPKHEYLSQARKTNDYEVRLSKSFALTENPDVFQQKTVRAFLEFMWSKARGRIVKNLFLPYLAFMLYFFVYLRVIQRLQILKEEDPQFYEFAATMVAQYDLIFKSVLFLGCFYFIKEDLQQVKSLANSPIVLWSYANIVPLIMMMFVVVVDMMEMGMGVRSQGGFHMTVYSLTAIFAWIRVVHLLKCFSHTSYLLRVAGEVLYKVRWLVALIGLSFISFTIYYAQDKSEDTYEGDQSVVVSTVVSAFFFVALLVALGVTFFNKNGVWSNEAYLDKACLIGLYSYLLEDKAVRDPKKDYLVITTLVENRKKALKDLTQSQINGGTTVDPWVAQAKLIKSIDRRLNQLSSKVDKSLREIQEKVGSGGPGAGH